MSHDVIKVCIYLAVFLVEYFLLKAVQQLVAALLIFADWFVNVGHCCRCADDTSVCVGVY